MPSPGALERKFWESLESDRTVMLGLDGVEDGRTRPMTAVTEDRQRPISLKKCLGISSSTVVGPLIRFLAK